MQLEVFMFNLNKRLKRIEDKLDYHERQHTKEHYIIFASIVALIISLGGLYVLQF